MQYKCLIVEDEPLAAEVLQDYIQQIPFLQLHSICPDAIFAMEVLQQEKIDLIFLDIHLPKLKGLDFLRTLKDPPNIVITSAYHEYALQGYEHNVIDYLLKPVSFQRFLSAVNKAFPKPAAERTTVSTEARMERQSLFFNVNKKKVRVFLDEILYIESLKEYIRIVTQGGNPIVTKFQISDIEALLPQNVFLRIHRSYIVARDKVDAITATDVEIRGREIPVGRNYKDLVQAAFGTVE